MSALFDNYDESYGRLVQSSIDFSGLPHAFFLSAKADLLARLVAEHFGPAQKPSLIDVGCGIGAMHPMLRGSFGRVGGVDVSAASIARARADNPAIGYKVYGGDALPYETGAFDVSLAVCAMHHVVPSGWPRFVAEMRRVVRPGGFVCIVEHNPLNPLTRRAVARCEFDRDAVLLRARQTKNLLHAAGLKAIDARFFLLLPSARAILRRLERRFERLPLGAQYAAWGTA